jgi:hypothetical protein
MRYLRQMSKLADGHSPARICRTNAEMSLAYPFRMRRAGSRRIFSISAP